MRPGIEWRRDYEQGKKKINVLGISLGVGNESE